jgi:hypothetical protein
MDQVVECLPRKSKALSSNSILPTKIKDYFWKSSMVVHNCNPCYSRGIGRNTVLQSWAPKKEKNRDPI